MCNIFYHARQLEETTSVRFLPPSPSSFFFFANKLIFPLVVWDYAVYYKRAPYQTSSEKMEFMSAIMLQAITASYFIMLIRILQTLWSISGCFKWKRNTVTKSLFQTFSSGLLGVIYNPPKRTHLIFQMQTICVFNDRPGCPPPLPNSPSYNTTFSIIWGIVNIDWHLEGGNKTLVV